MIGLKDNAQNYVIFPRLFISLGIVRYSRVHTVQLDVPPCIQEVRIQMIKQNEG
jgi:hypothetical protein